MILVAKPNPAPASLAPGVAETAAICASYDADPEAYADGRAKFEFKSGIYGSLTLKGSLKSAQHGKCCYCEAIFNSNYSGDVEHYRPKGAIGAGKRRIQPGYYWLAYAWDNLFYACADCNQYRKRAAFPLADEAKRALDHHGMLADEDPLLLNPGGPRDPRGHISFNRDVPISHSEAGRTTIQRINLDREALCASRRKHLRLLEALLEIIRLARGDPQPDRIETVTRARAALAACMKPDAEFSAATEDFLLPRRHLWE